ncbi:MAG: hypothetical protein Q9218_007030 [Villophora microphyllina]
MTQHYKNALLSAILKRQMCFIVCSSKFPGDPKFSNFEPEPGKYCEAKCSRGDDEEIKVHDLEDSAKPDTDWRIQVQDFLKASYNHYKEHGFRTDQMLPSPDALFDGKVTPNSGSYLPVCDSYFSYDIRKKISGLPCVCGDKYGSETVDFWKATNFDSWITDHSADNREYTTGPVFQCRSDMAVQRTPPVAFFLNMCNMDWRWPIKADRIGLPDSGLHQYDYRYLQKGADPLCEEFKRQIRIWPDPAVDLNCGMCFKNPVGQDIQEQQLDIIWNLFDDWGGHHDYNFDRACDFVQGC